jgi:hypothetical protein
MVICSLCNGFGKRLETIVEYVHVKQCTACDGTGHVPHVANWRPFEATKETIAATHPNCKTCEKCKPCGWCRCG